MIAFISILIALFVAAALFFLWKSNRKHRDEVGEVPVVETNIDPSCCGAHEVCDFDATKADPTIVEYFEDEDLDKLRAINPGDYSEEQIDQLREVLYTLQTHEIRKWLLSLERRYIHLPDFLIQEARDLQTDSL
jgi:hypothetical protein